MPSPDGSLRYTTAVPSNFGLEGRYALRLGLEPDVTATNERPLCARSGHRLGAVATVDNGPVAVNPPHRTGRS